ncbi:hypothetical protein Tco_0225979 [Tanacetum coccineum]
MQDAKTESKMIRAKALDAVWFEQKALGQDSKCKMTAAGQQHTEQPEIIVEGRVDQYPETCQVKSPMLDSSPDNQTTEYSKQSLESENILLKRDCCPIFKKRLIFKMEAQLQLLSNLNIKINL